MDNVNKKDPDSSIEPMSIIKASNNTTMSTVVPDYYADIPYVESLGKYIPQNEKHEVILVLALRKKTFHKELQQWSDWANKKVMQATQRLGKDQAELKMLRQEKEDAEKVHKEKQMQKENIMKRFLEKEQVLLNTISNLNRLEREYVALEEEMEALKLSTSVSAKSIHKSLEKEQDTVKKCQAAELEKRTLLEELSTLKKKQLIYNSNKRKQKSALTSLRSCESRRKR